MHRTLTSSLCSVFASLAIFLGPTLAIAQSGNGRQITKPPVSVSADVVDFGDVPPRTKVIRTARISNDSDEPIRITGVRVSCGCTIAEWPEEWIQPGEFAEIELTFDSGDLWGPVQRYALLVVEGYNRPLRITTTAHVNTGIRASRTYDPPGQMLAGRITLRSTDGVPFRVRTLSFARETNDAEDAPGTISRDDLDPTLATPALEHVIAFDFSKVDPDRLRRWVAIETDHPGAPVVAMHIDNIYAGVDRRRSLWAYSKDHLLLGVTEAGEPVEHEFILRGVRTDSGVQRIETSTDLVQAEVVSTELDQAQGLVVRVRFTPGADVQGLVHSTLTVRAIDFEDEVEFMLRVRPDSEAGPDEPAGS